MTKDEEGGPGSDGIEILAGATGGGIQGAVGPRVVVGGRVRDYFAGCSYLGLQNHPELIAAATAALARFGLGTATSRGGYGEHPVYLALEAAAARYFDTEAALYYATAYLGSTILLQGLDGEYDRVFADEAAHFSVRDAAQAAGRPFVTFRHNDPGNLAAQLHSRLGSGERPLVITDGVFPISGEIAPLPAYAGTLAAYPGAVLCIDDAHGTGVLGANGRGTLEHWRELGADFAGVRVFAAHTFSKALGCHGGLIAGDATLIRELRDRAAAWVAHSPSPLPTAAAAVRALELAGGNSPLRRQLWARVSRARAGLRMLGWELADSPVPIICLRARPGLDLARLKDELFRRDICVAHVTRYTSTPPGGALRIAIFATHTPAQIERLVEQLGDLSVRD